MIRWTLFALILVHAAIHLMGFARAFGLADLPQLTQPISRPAGMLWLLAAFALVACAVLYVAAPRIWWAVGFAAVLLSQAVIVTAWRDAAFGTIANIALLLVVAYGFASEGPVSFRATYLREVGKRLAGPVSPGPVTEADLARLPEPVQRTCASRAASADRACIISGRSGEAASGRDPTIRG